MTRGPTAEPDRSRGRTEGDPSIGELFRQLAQDRSTLVRQEIELATEEIGESVRRTATGAGWVAAGALTALLGLLVLIAALVVGLGGLLGSYWLAALIVGLVFVVIGAALALTAAKRLKRLDLKPTATLEALQDDKRWAQAEIRRAKRELARPTD